MIPKFQILLLALGFATVIGCEKSSFLSGPDKVTFHQFDPAPEITPIDSIYYYPGSPDPTIYSSHPKVDYLLDVDGDSNPDFKLTATIWGQWVSNSSPGANTNFEMSVTGIESTSEVAVTMLDEVTHKVTFYNPGESINPTADWKNSSSLMRTGGSVYGPSKSDFHGTKYIGLRVKKHSRRYYCWLKVSKTPGNYEHKLLIHSFGYNRSKGNDIATGQRE